MSNNQLTKSKRAMNIIFFVMFTLFAVIQLNDPDSLLWFSIYMGVAMVSIIANYIAIPKFVIIILALALLLYSGVYFGFLMDWLNTENKSEIFGEMVYDKPYLEGTREFIGLLIAFAAILFQLKK